MSFKKLITACSLLSLTLITAGALTSSPRASAETATYDIDGSHSIVIFKVRHLGIANFYGTFDELTGEVHYNESKPSECSIRVEIDSTSIDANSDDRNALLKDTDFFDSENHPAWTFESTEVAQGKDGHLKLSGDLTLRGKTKKIEADLETVGVGETFMGERAGWEARFTIDRTDFEISGVLGGLGKEIEVIVAIEGVKRAE